MIGIIRAAKPIALFCILLVAACSQAFMPRHSFLVHPVANTSDLVNQVSENRTVLDRYERHFAMTGKQVVAYMKTLRVGRILETKVRNVYLVREDGMLDMKPELVKAGTKVFMDPTGKPILMVVCGNPMVAPKESVNFDNPSLNSSTSEFADIPVAQDSEAAPMADAIQPADATPIEEIATTPPPTVITETAAQPIIAAAGPNLGGLLGFLPLLGIHGGGSTPGTPPPPPTTPEPASVVALTIAAVGVIAMRRSR